MKDTPSYIPRVPVHLYTSNINVNIGAVHDTQLPSIGPVIAYPPLDTIFLFCDCGPTPTKHAICNARHMTVYGVWIVRLPKLKSETVEQNVDQLAICKNLAQLQVNHVRIGFDSRDELL